jgi:hypothetical protein
MPSHPIHITMDEILFGRGVFFPEIHKYLDRMQPYFQSNHRLYFHDLQTVYDIYYMTGNYVMALSAYFHILLDLVSDEVGQEHAIAELTKRIQNGEIKI